MNYTDILTEDLSSVRADIIQKDEVRCNVIETRCIIKWEGETPASVLALGITSSDIRTEGEAKVYYTGVNWDAPL